MKVNEIFKSIQGEGPYVGRSCVFVRFSGCNLSCPFCDTDHESGTEMSEQEIVEEVWNKGELHKTGAPRFVVLTGGEPLLQVNYSLLMRLKEIKFRNEGTAGSGDVPIGIHLETNGAVTHERLAAHGDRSLTNASWLSLFDEITVSPKIPICGEGPESILRHASTLKMLYPFPGCITLEDVVYWVMDMEKVRYRIQFDFECFPKALVKSTVIPAHYVIQPVTPPLDDVGAFKCTAREAYHVMTELSERTGQQWSLLPQIHRFMGLE